MLTQYLQKAISAHAHTSHTPEKRGEMMVKEYSNLLQSDIELLQSQGKETEAYKAKFISLWLTWLARKSNCFSVMITGASGFNRRRHEKVNNSEQKAWQVFHDWRENYFKKVSSKSKPKGVDSELAEARKQLESNFQQLNIMKAVNKAIKQAKGVQSKEVELLQQLGIKEALIVEILNPKQPYRKGFESFQLTNCRNRLKNYEARVEMLERKIGQRDGIGNVEYKGECVKVIINREADRVQIFHDSKPAQAVIIELKKHAFNWSPSNGCWQRKLTQHGIFAAQQVTKIKLL